MITRADVEQVISNLGLSALGVASPLLAVRWTTASVATTTPDEGGPGSLSLTSADSWVAPAAGILSVGNGTGRILLPNGASATVGASVLRLYPQVYLRLARLMAVIVEGQTADTHLPMRPVPYYFVYSDTSGSPAAGDFAADDDLGFSGTMTIHDKRGLAIDPVAVASSFDAIIEQFGVLEARELLETATTPQAGRQIHHIGTLGTNQMRIHIVDPHGQPYDGSHLENVTAVDAGSGLFTPDDATAPISVASAAGTPDGLRLGPATTGTLADAFSPRTAAVTLHRDFLRAVAVDLKPFLLGERPEDDPAAAFEPLPDVRHNENVNFSLNGNAAYGAVNTILAGSPAEGLIVSPVIESDFDLPVDTTDANAQWPNFPAGLAATPDAILNSLRDDLNPSAHFITGTEADVVLVLNGLIPGLAVRVYNRQFLPDAREGRGDGAGTVVTDAGGRVALVLEDPLGLVERGSPTTLPGEATLHVDLVLVNSNSQARVFGNVVCAIGPAAALTAEESGLLVGGSNGFDTLSERGVSSASILGLPAPAMPAGPFTSLEAIRDLALALGSEGTPRDAPRLPTMARREAVVASGDSGAWRGQVSGMHMVSDSRNARQRLGSPGSPGGKEFQIVSVQTQGGRLAYDIARAGLRRTRNIITRLEELAGPGISGTNWTEPAAAATATISAAVLQTIAPATETPELALFESQLGSLPATWTDFVDSVVSASLFGSLPNPFRTQLTTALNNLRGSTVGDRLYNEFKREFSAAVHGRRDALWALKRVLSSAREFIYIEGPAFMTTDYGASPTNDLVTIIRDRLQGSPGLRLILNLSKELDYGPGYEVFAAREYAKRLEVINNLSAVAENRVVAFHPIGYPGRPLRLMTNIVIIDDVWAMIGSSAIRRRGLMFDGGLDVVLFDRELRTGQSVAVANLRRDLMAAYLGVEAPSNGEIPHASWVRLADGQEAFWVFKELIDQGGAGLIEPLWNGQFPGVPLIDPADFPVDNVADPDGRAFETGVALLVAALASVATPPLPP